MTDRSSLRVVLAGLLVASAALFVTGVFLERGGNASAEPAAVHPEPSAHVEGAGEEGEGAQTTPAAESRETPEEHAAEARPLGIDLESPLLVGVAVVASLVLAVAVLRSVSPLVPLAIVAFAALFAILDLVELAYQLEASRTGLAAVAGIIALLHIATAIVALWLVISARRTQPGTA